MVEKGDVRWWRREAGERGAERAEDLLSGRRADARHRRWGRVLEAWRIPRWTAADMMSAGRHWAAGRQLGRQWQRKGVCTDDM